MSRTNGLVLRPGDPCLEEEAEATATAVWRCSAGKTAGSVAAAAADAAAAAADGAVGGRMPVAIASLQAVASYSAILFGPPGTAKV